VASDSEHSQLEVDALRTLYEGYLKTLQASSERQFRTLLQTLTLNVAVVAGLIGLATGKVVLLEPGRWVGSILLFLFDLVVAAYLLRQGSFYVRERKQFQSIRKALLEKCPSVKLGTDDKEQSLCCHLWSGTVLFSVAVVIAAICSITAIWTPLVASQNP